MLVALGRSNQTKHELMLVAHTHDCRPPRLNRECVFITPILAPVYTHFDINVDVSAGVTQERRLCHLVFIPHLSSCGACLSFCVLKSHTTMTLHFRRSTHIFCTSRVTCTSPYRRLTDDVSGGSQPGPRRSRRRRRRRPRRRGEKATGLRLTRTTTPSAASPGFPPGVPRGNEITCRSKSWG